MRSPTGEGELAVPGHVPAGEPYESRFGNWENRASVRTKPRRLMHDSGEAWLFFPPESVPAVFSPLVEARGPEVVGRILLDSLYQYLHFTTVLEQAAVLPVTARISLGTAGVDLPAGMVSDAFKITTDEAWHAQFAHDFIQEVARATGVPPLGVVQPRFVRRLAVIRESFDPDLRHLVDLVFAVVSETLVSALLSDIPNDRRLPRPVRALVADHPADEGRHHAYFRSFLRYLWPGLSERERRLIGPRVPDFVRAFLDPDIDAVSTALRLSGFDPDDIAEILDQHYSADSPIFDIEPAARATIRSFREVGALDDPATHDRFLAAGLVTGS